MILGHTIKDYKRENLLHDVITGIIIMAVSIPISMGYSQIAGLPAVYGLYGSVFPIILFALFSTSPQFIFGVDAAPAALVGSALLGMNIQSGSKEALAVVPVITFFVALWLLAFYLMHAGKLVNYISAPVMGGFITGICSTIILMLTVPPRSRILNLSLFPRAHPVPWRLRPVRSTLCRRRTPRMPRISSRTKRSLLRKLTR